jgi:hypothetical protein
MERGPHPTFWGEMEREGSAGTPHTKPHQQPTVPCLYLDKLETHNPGGQEVRRITRRRQQKPERGRAMAMAAVTAGAAAAAAAEAAESTAFGEQGGRVQHRLANIDYQGGLG